MKRHAVTVLLVALGACRGGEGAPACAAVANNFALLATKDLEGSTADADMRRAVREQLPAMRDALDHACADSAWSGAVRTCLYDAKDARAFQTCEAQLTEAQRRELARLEAGEKSDR